MQTNHRALNFLLALAPTLFVIVIPTFVVGRYLDPPYNLLGWAIVLAVAGFVRSRMLSRYSNSHTAGKRRVFGH